MSYIEENLLSIHEKPIIEIRKSSASQRIMWMFEIFFTVGFFLLVGILYIIGIKRDISSIIFIGAIIFFYIAVLMLPIYIINTIDHHKTEYVLTENRVIKKTGIIGRQIIETQINKIEDIEIECSILGRICGYATIKMKTANKSDIEFHKIENAMEVKKTINLLMDR